MRDTKFSFNAQVARSTARMAFFAFVVQWGTAGCSASAQSKEAAQSLSSSVIVVRHPFSAVKFTRTIHVAKDGVTQTVEEKGHALVARDAEGRIFLSGFVSFDRHCDLPDLGRLPRCAIWSTSLFDPPAGLMWHWCMGEVCDKTQYVQIDLQSDQVAEAERLTSVFQAPPQDDPHSGISVQDLGEHDIEGVRARGVRTTTIRPRETNKPDVTIHEVWTSAPMRLVLRVVDATEEGEITVSGLEHISLSPNAALFLRPVERILRHWKDGYIYAGSDLEDLATWLVR